MHPFFNPFKARDDFNISHSNFTKTILSIDQTKFGSHNIVLMKIKNNDHPNIFIFILYNV